MNKLIEFNDIVQYCKEKYHYYKFTQAARDFRIAREKEYKKQFSYSDLELWIGKFLRRSSGKW